MSLIAALEAMVESGATPEMMLAVARKMEAAREAELAERRAKDAQRAKHRASLLPEDWAERRTAVFERDGYICVYCDADTCDPHCDHVMPLSRGGSSEMDNLATACGPCNSSKGARTVEEWLGRR